MEIWFDPIKVLEEVVIETAEKQSGFSKDFLPDVRPADPRFGDFQANGILAEAKRSNINPRELAQKFVEELKKSSSIDESLVSISVAGPGFINFRFSNEFLGKWLSTYKDAGILKDACKKIYAGKKVVIDYPSPNTAKQMHVGHLRILVIGEAVSRLLDFCGANLTRDNHIGDWGTNFGILIFEIKRTNYVFPADDAKALSELEELYKSGTAYVKDESHVGALDEARSELVKLQRGDQENVKLWERIVKVSNSAFQKIYDIFGVHPDVTLGESFYRDKVERVYKELLECGIAEESDGALVVWNDEDFRYSRKNENAAPFIIRKKDGGSNYASTDLATLLYRVEKFGADEVVYVTDDRQQDHFRMLSLTAARWFSAKGYRLPKIQHVTFGKILGENGKPIKTKEGGSIKLKSLVEEAVSRAFAVVKEKNADLPEDEQRKISKVIGISALKYADLLQNRTIDYVFSWDRLLSFEGNTAPYLLYAVARIRSIYRKSGADLKDLLDEKSVLTPSTPTETALIKHLMKFSSVIKTAIEELKPHYICTYLFGLAGAFSSFYTADKIVVEDEKVRTLRLRLCASTCEVLETGLNLLGIETLDRM